jgi:small subunit ribosomal protein S4
MARYTGPMTKKSRRYGADLKGDDKNYEKRPYPPGQHGRARVKESEYRSQLHEKQKARYYYGVLEKQFRRYYDEATRGEGRTGENLLTLLELRLDNVVYRSGFARTRREARQLCSHRHLLVNGQSTNVASLRLSPGDVVVVRDKKSSRESQAILGSLEVFGSREAPAWLHVEADAFKITVQEEPIRAQIDVPVQEQMIVELYSK